MKKYFYIILFAGLLAASCSKDVSILNQPSEDGTYTFVLNASVADDATKTAYASDKTFSWSKGDQISVIFNNGTENKYFTLTAGNNGPSAKFSGEITTGYSIGDKDNGAKFALFPAAAHGWDDTNKRPIFNIPAVTDFTVAGAHFSANLPMYAIGDASDNFEFTHNACAYKFSFKNIDNSISKVRLTVTHNQTHKLSGNFPLNSAYKWYAQYASAGSADQSVSYVVNVASNKAVFYFAIGKDSESAFQPTITLFDEDTGFIIYRATAKSAFSSDDLKPLESRMVVLPEISAPGTGSPLISAYGVDWSSVTYQDSGSTGSGEDAVKKLMATSSADGQKLYLYFEIDATKLQDIAAADYSNQFTWYLKGDSAGSSGWSYWSEGSFESYIDGWVKRNNSVTMTEWNSNISSNFTQAGNIVYVEQEVLRSGYACLQGTSCQVGLTINSKVNNDSSITSTTIGYAPAKSGPMLTVTMPAYVAP